ncbi:MAG: hypothetical protein Q9174_002961, partial [Haloplaca sp. 1 TL-2023]
LDDDFEPLYSLNITYSHEHVVGLGNKIKPSAVSHPPDLYTNPMPTLRGNETWAFVLTDPDALSRENPSKAEMCHWIVTFTIDTDEDLPVIHLPMNLELPGDLAKHPNTADVTPVELMTYYPPAPPPKTGYHRYVFVLLAPASGKDTPYPSKPKERPHWGYGKVRKGVRDWAKDNYLTPVAANFFYAKNKKQ